MTIGDRDAVPFIHNQSPLGLIGAFTLILRERFSPKNRMPWCFTDNPGTDTIHIYPQFDQGSEAKNLAPRIVVAKGPTVYQRVSVGDLDQNQPGLMNRGIRYGHQLSEVSWSLECIAENMGESSTIGDYVGSTITDAAPILEKAFHIRRIGVVIVQQTKQYDTDKKKWITEVEFRTNGEHRWVTMPAATVLRRYESEIKLRQEATIFISKFMNNEVA